MNTFVSNANAAVGELRRAWGWLLTLGILLAGMGLFAIVYQGASSIASVMAFGAVLVAAGIVQLASTFQARGAGHAILYLLLGAFDLVIGFVLIAHPAVGAMAITLVLSAYFLVGGIYRVMYALWLQFPQYGWFVFNGVVMAALGVLLWMQWPGASFWFLGFAVGVNFIITGLTWIAVAVQARGVTKLPVAG